MNYFVEGLQGSGKSTMVQKLSVENPSCTVFREGDYSPVELAWCAYVDKVQYRDILNTFSSMADEIRKKTVREDDRYIIMYTQIHNAEPGFYIALEQHEIYNGRVAKGEFEDIVLTRFKNWEGDNSIFECSIFQNIIENQILYFGMTDDEIVAFYQKLKSALGNKEYRIVYMFVDDIRASIEVIRKERCDENGRELWFPLMLQYLKDAPYSGKMGNCDMDGLICHMEHRRKLEMRILQEVFDGYFEIVKRTVHA